MVPGAGEQTKQAEVDKASAETELSHAREENAQLRSDNEGLSAAHSELSEKLKDAEARLAAATATQAEEAKPEQPRKFRLTATIDADSPDKMAALVKQLSARYGDPLQVSEKSGDFVQHGDMADCVAHIEVKPDPAPAAPADQAQS